ncbi:hypothetical protein ABI_02860 [Asticcacaulis biprosthecium C19]|uniref:Transmembrane anti-sigma factor n=1 Tax=Asticcacaulis biprosthecium C19 TaxID=715226 RepID=F4QIU5_9CAUL|nr:hypothetical protein [Asticcacaulis biprosthecium]EGF91854.1 hypothetical protein ABI_02860 [Asticcacaulis biprosthecium C19]
MTISDEVLNAYLDGELEAGDMEAVDRALATDETVVARLAALAEADRAYISELAAIDARPLPSGLDDLLADPVPESGARVLAFPGKARWDRLRPYFVPTAAAASITAIIGFGVGFAVGPGSGAVADPFTALSRGTTPVIAMLDERESGQIVDIGHGMSAQVRLTFPAADGNLCREFDVQSPKAAAAGIACRSDKGWDIRLAARQSAPAQGTGYVTAASADDPVFGRAVEALMAGDPLDGEAETAAIKNGWQKPLVEKK